MEQHVIIIGSGLGGLTCGYILAKNGFKVTVLEKNSQIGGCLQTFTRKGVKFETGMHYIGSMEEGQTLYHYFKYLSLLKDVKLSSLDKTCYDIISLDGKRYPFSTGEIDFVEQLAQHFPTEKQNLKNYRQQIKKIAESSPFYSFRDIPPLRLSPFQYLEQNASDFIASITSNPILQNVLAGNLPLYAGIKHQTPLYIHALINDFFNQSAFRIVGGSDTIAASLTNSIRQMGGEVCSHSKVTKINCNEGAAVSVSLENGEIINADHFISDIHPARTIELIDSHLLRKSYRNRILNLENTVSNFTVYIRFIPHTVPYLNSNFFYYAGKNVWKTEKWGDQFLYMHLCPPQNSSYAEGAVLIADMSFSEVAKWQGTHIGQRGDDYEQLKHRKAEQLLLELEKQMPGTIQNIACYYTSTPLTYLDYTGTEAGANYGILKDANNLLQTTVLQCTKIPNLLLTGQNINNHGILGVIITSFLTAGALIGLDFVYEQLRDSF